jgi:hypothetical protein
MSILNFKEHLDKLFNESHSDEWLLEEIIREIARLGGECENV